MKNSDPHPRPPPPSEAKALNSEQKTAERKDPLLSLALGAVGVVFGDIGTSPLYTVREFFHAGGGFTTGRENVLGVISLVLWTLILVVFMKYSLFVMRADNRGEGGILALLTLALRRSAKGSAKRGLVLAAGILGAALFYGDGMITPAISVLSAVEGMGVATPAFSGVVVPLAVGALIALFFFQGHGSARLGAIFGPVMVLWFLTIGLLGIRKIAVNPEILEAINPFWAINLFLRHGFHGFLALGAVILCVTGAEALYADMGHFGKKAIRVAWNFLVFPTLALNYLGQGALLLDNPVAAENPFYLLAPREVLYPLVALATLATIIASQSVISGAFSITQQAIQMGFLPRMAIVHTSEKEKGQIYAPAVNHLLLALVLLLVLGFGSSSALAGAYGIAVAGTMTATTLLASGVVSFPGWMRHFRWPALSLFLAADLSFLGANCFKIPQGGWFPLVMGVALALVIFVWIKGRSHLAEIMEKSALPLEVFLANLDDHPPVRVPGTAIYLTGNPQGVPPALLHNLKHNKVLHERVVLLTVAAADVPFVADEERVTLSKLGESFYRVLARFGFKEKPDIPKVLALCGKKDLFFDLMDTTFFLSKETLVPRARPGLARVKQELFAAMSKNAMRVTDFFSIPANRVVELGMQIELY